MQSGVPHDDGTTLHRTWHNCAWGATKGKYAVDAGGPSGEPLAESEIEPVWHQTVQTVVQAKEKLKYLDQEIEAAKRTVIAKVGSGHPP